MSWDYADGGDQAGKNHIKELLENTSYDFMVNYGIYATKTSTTKIGGGNPFGTLIASPNTLKMLKGAMWTAGIVAASGASITASLY